MPGKLSTLSAMADKDSPVFMLNDQNYDSIRNILGARFERDFFVISMMVNGGEGFKAQTRRRNTHLVGGAWGNTSCGIDSTRLKQPSLI